jgi:hypothetical protein
MYISRRGFFLPKTSKLCDTIRAKLLVTPNINKAFDFSDEGPVSFNVFQETEQHLVLPRFFGKTEFKYNNFFRQVGTVGKVAIAGNNTNPLKQIPLTSATTIGGLTTQQL